MWTELELAWRLFLHCSCILGYWKNSDSIYFLHYNTSQSQHYPLSHGTEVLLSPSFKYYRLYTRHRASRYAGYEAFIWGHSACLIWDDQYSLPFSKGCLWPLMAHELTIIHSTHWDRNKSGYGYSSNTIKKEFWHSFCVKVPFTFTALWKRRGTRVKRDLPVQWLGESLPNAQASVRTQCYQVNTILASPSLSAMLGNKEPNLEAKMEKGISNSQKGGGGGSPLAMPHVFNEKQPLDMNCSFYS